MTTSHTHKVTRPMEAVYDAVIVGGGGSGLAAAVSASEHGLSVLLLEKHPELGGATGIAVGSFTANRTSFQRTAGVDDSLEAHVEDAGMFAPPAIEARNQPELRHWFLSHGNETLEWLRSLGLNFHGPSPEPPNRVPRMHNVVPNAKAYIAVLQARLLKLGGKVLTSAPVVDLIQDHGRVIGVVAEVKGTRLRYGAQRGVVLAAGDYANSPEIIARFKGSQFADIEGINPRASGDGHLLAERAGAQLVNMDVTYGPELRFIPPPSQPFQQLLPVRGPLARLMGLVVPLLPHAILHAMIRRLLVTWQHPENALFEDGALLVNQKGERFCDERRWPEREITLARQPGKLGYILLDQRLSQRYSRWPHFISTAPRIAYAYAQDYLRLRPDVAVQANTLAELSARRDLPPEALEKSVADYNLAAQAADRPSLKNGPWLLLGPAKAYFTTTEGGAAIDHNFAVLDKDGIPVPGLYAVGQTGLGGQVLWGHGLHIAWALTSGRLVGVVLATIQ